MARVEGLKSKVRRLNIAIIIISVVIIFALQILLNRIEFSGIGKYLYPNFWHQPHYIFSITSVCINLLIPLIVIYFLTRSFYKKNLAKNINHLYQVIQNLKNNDEFHTISTNVTEFNEVIEEVEEINVYLKERIKKQLTIQNNFKKKLDIFEHDLKTPLTVVQGHIELLKKINDSELSQQEIKEKIDRETQIVMESLYRVNNQLRIHINNINLLPEDTSEISLDKVLSTIRNSYSTNYILGDKELKYKIDYSALNEEVYINNQILYHVIDNIINNALKYAETLIIIEVYIENYMLHFAVENDGKCFSEDELLSAKEWGIKDAHSNGSGIGLYFANEVIKQYGSEIKIENVNHRARVSFKVEVKI
ncbi:HAMP domain-containing histidine kinase [Staphylococcus pettenkoferi]|uniref:sensor histidine kinase n=1 Tax=Staphylococcus pettenkoferi TaxID=170573 RepID=UPI002273F970|nr:HAMP domain-containing sensor histidine kinase [Staphylococcus pettenkoferi]MCY1589560.1 HAMP domain-containing histidine kinase [Staphylococcus pettenkoferi]MCY1599065.1 HAMP domain-containing histidine kinase [Staphylococcus pettenkoferi]MCY1602624.1 HAMP domain-containing histidine kinase [Staphylococcus pettenkoferi]MCY1608938.1 HAMP domain-containing histidine kinase [Staphylococcus pettenkoferi]MCY1612840.1 HAMP domain-containing histidine kinase [Staphylococcus pettenkoferi]